MSFWTQEKADKIVELYMKGYTVRDCGRAVGANGNQTAGKLERELRARGINRTNYVNRVNERPPTLLEADILAPDRREPEPIEPTVIYDARRSDRHCKWPVGWNGREHLFCGCVALRGKSYCEPHGRKLYAERKT